MDMEIWCKQWSITILEVSSVDKLILESLGQNATSLQIGNATLKEDPWEILVTEIKNYASHIVG